MAALKRLVVRHLVHGGAERYALRRTPELARGLRDALAGPDALLELRSVLKLVVALDRKLASRGAAKALRELIHEQPEAAALLRTIAGPSTARVQARFARLEGRRERPRAASVTAVPPAGSIPLRDLIDPLRREPLRPPSASGARPTSTTGRPSWRR